MLSPSLCSHSCSHTQTIIHPLDYISIISFQARQMTEIVVWFGFGLGGVYLYTFIYLFIYLGFL